MVATKLVKDNLSLSMMEILLKILELEEINFVHVFIFGAISFLFLLNIHYYERIILKC